MRISHVSLLALGCAAFAAGCSGGSSGSSPAPKPSASATPTPTATPTIASTTLTSGDALLELCDTSASPAPSYPPVPGTYSLVAFSGNLTGSTFTVSSSNSGYQPVTLTTATSTPEPVTTATATASPLAVQLGSYSVPGYTISQTVVSPTTGCMLMYQESAPSPAPSQLPQNAAAVALPFSPTAVIDGQITGNVLSGGQVTAVSLGSFSPFTGGSGTFTLDNGVVGNFTFGQTQMVTIDELARMKSLLRGRLRPAGLLP